MTNTASSYVPIINIDNADKYVGNYAFQLLVHTTSYSTGFRQAEDENGIKLFDEDGDPICEPYNIPHEQILSNVVQDPTAENPFVRNPFVLNPFRPQRVGPETASFRTRSYRIRSSRTRPSRWRLRKNRTPQQRCST